MRGLHARWSDVRRKGLLAVDASSVAVVRILMAAIILWEVVRYFTHNWIKSYWIDPSFHFTYFGFGWVHPWPGNLLYLHFALMGLAALAVLFGLYYRAASVFLAISFAYQFLLEQARYLNHFYAALLILVLLAVLPAHAEWSIDRRRRQDYEPATVPAWVIWVLRFQVGVIYFYGGLAKLNVDWLGGAPTGLWMNHRATVPFVDFLLRHGLHGVFFGVGGMLFDLFVVPFLLLRPTRPYAFIAAICFHFINAQLFPIGIFPWMMVATTTIFFVPSWPRSVLTYFSAPRVPRSKEVSTFDEPRRPLLAFLAAFMVVQLTVPFRHWLYPGDVAWTEEGHRFSWRMMLRDKAGSAQFLVVSGSDTAWVSAQQYLRPWQMGAMIGNPDMLLQFGHHLRDEFQRRGKNDARVYVRSLVSLNGRKAIPIIADTSELGRIPRTLGHANWITAGPGDKE
ncbi:MAG: HTTM domain-containing protein [Gemmatimonadota bacterium]